MSITYGFFTMATGKDLYYKLAANMYRSYKAHGGKLPFAIVCDRHNKYTKLFDKVIILDDVQNNYLDKFKLFLNLPYDENFFIEPDCLIYRNIDSIFNLFKNSPDFFAFNVTYADLTHDGWFVPPEPITRKYPQLNYFWGFNPGYMYFRKKAVMKSIYEDCLEIAGYLQECSEYKNHPKLFFEGTLRDDPVIWLSVAKNIPDLVQNIDISKIGMPVSLPGSSIVNISQYKEKLDIIDEYDGTRYDNNFLLHFSTRRTKEGLYSHQYLVVKMIKYPILKPIVVLLEQNEVRNYYLKIHKFLRGLGNIIRN